MTLQGSANRRLHKAKGVQHRGSEGDSNGRRSTNDPEAEAVAATAGEQRVVQAETVAAMGVSNPICCSEPF